MTSRQRRPFKVGIVQAAPVCFDADGCLAKIEDFAADAARQGARLVAVGETWLPGYPTWIDHSPGALLWGDEANKEAFAVYRENSITVPGPHHDRLSRLARRLGVVLVVGCSESVEQGPGRGTLYNSLLTYDSDGSLVNHHRKLVPTYTERVIWGAGDAAGLRSAATAAGPVTSLVCWEHWMPLPRQVLHEAGELVHVAVWPWVNEHHLLASRQYAFEGRCFVLAVGQIQRGSDIPRGLGRREGLSDDDLILRGGSVVIGPDASLLTDPVLDREAVIVAEIDPRRAERESMTLDVTGHYHRPELLGVFVDFGDRPVEMAASADE